MGIAEVTIANELMLGSMHFPGDTQIVNARMSDDGRSVILRMVHPDLKPAKEGDFYPVASPRFVSNSTGWVGLDSWGQE